MEYAINHVHIRSSAPRTSEAWYEKYFNAKILWEREVMPGTVTVSMEVGGPVRLNISSKPEGSSKERSVAELNRLGLEHFGFGVLDLEKELHRLEGPASALCCPLPKSQPGPAWPILKGRMACS